MPQPYASNSPSCTICGKTADSTLTTLHFAPKMHLPDTIGLYGCSACDFAFVSPASQQDYAAYYASQRTDLIHEEAPDNEPSGWVRTQAPVFRARLSTNTPLTILDYGCGGGDLLKLLARQYPNHQFVGFDMHENRRPSTLPNLRFVSSTAGLENSCDLVILSHVLEHFADFSELTKVTALAKEAGTVYIELPNPSTYTHSLQREFLFFIDRMHLSHFSPKAMLLLARQHGLRMQGYGTLNLPYRDSTTYPSHYFFFEKHGGDMLADINAYITTEKKRPSTLSTLAPETPILVYGFGDNFFRCRSAGGPLEGRKILAIIDQRHAELSHSPLGKQYHFLSAQEALDTYPEAPIIITITWGAAEVTQTLRAMQRTPAPILTA